jgi:YVTN family beta-propeller protein
MNTKSVNHIQRVAWTAFVVAAALGMILFLAGQVAEVAAQPDGRPQGFDFQSDYVTSSGDYAFVTLSSSNLVAVINTATNVLVNTVDVGASGCSFPWRATIKPDGSQVYVSCRYSNNVVVINSSSLAIVHVIGPIPQADDIAFRRDGQFAFIGSRFTNQVVVVNTSTYFQLAVPTNGYARSLAAHPFLDLIYVTSGAGEILILDSVTNTITGSIDVVNEPWDVAVSPDGQWLYTGDRWGQGLSVVDLNSNSVITTLSLPGALTGLDIAPDGSKLYAARLYDGVYIIDTATWQAVSVGVSGQAWETAVTCDGSKLYVGSTQDFVPIIDTTTQVVVNLPMPGYGARGIAICPQYVADGLILFPKTQQKQDALGSTIVYTTTLRNETGESDSFDLALAGNAWPTEISTTTLGPLNQGEAATFVVTVTVPSGAAWYDTDTVTVTATSVTSPTVYSETAVLTTEAYAPPQISVAPDSFSSTQLVNSQVMQTLTISNGHGVTLTYTIDAISGSALEGSLEEILDSLNANYQAITDVIPNRFDFSEGETGYYIIDGGNDMYDGGNYLSTDLGGYIMYSNNLIVPGAEFGANGRYFTRKYPGLFFLAADMTGVDYFEISGNLGADGGGYADGTVLQLQHYGNSYYGFVKRVYDAGDPSVNHLIIVANNPAADHVFATYTDDDFHRVFNLSPDTRMYYLLYAGSNGYYIDNEATLGIMEAFLNTLPVDAASPWLAVSPTAGSLPPNSVQDFVVTFDSTNLQPGDYQGSLVINSNDPVNGRITLPASLTVEPTATMGWVEGYVTDSRFGTPLQATIVAVGQPYTITAGLDGYYKLWLEAGSYDLHVSAPGYVAQQHTITIVPKRASAWTCPGGRCAGLWSGPRQYNDHPRRGRYSQRNHDHLQ